MQKQNNIMSWPLSPLSPPPGSSTSSASRGGYVLAIHFHHQFSASLINKYNTSRILILPPSRHLHIRSLVEVVSPHFMHFPSATDTPISTSTTGICPALPLPRLLSPSAINDRFSMSHPVVEHPLGTILFRDDPNSHDFSPLD